MAPPKLSMDDTIKLIRLYKERECLWRSDSVEYRNKAARDSALLWIKDSMGIPNMTVEDIKTKLKYIRSTFVQEQNKIKKSRKSGAGSADVYVPTLKWFNEMASFITYNPSTTSEFNNVEIDMDNSQENVLEENVSAENSTANTSQVTLTNRDSVEGERPPKSKRSRLAQLNYAINNMKEASQNLNDKDEDDEYTAFGIHIAKQLRKLSIEQYLYAQEEIQSIITRCRLQDLQNTRRDEINRYSTNVPVPSSSTSNSHGPGTTQILSQGSQAQRVLYNSSDIYVPVPSASPASIISSSSTSNSHGPSTILYNSSDIYVPVPSVSPGTIISSSSTSNSHGPGTIQILSQDILKTAYESAVSKE